MNRKSEEIKEKQISEVMASIENRVRHAYNQGYEQGVKDSKQETCEQIKWERDTAIKQLNELGYALGEKIEPCEDCISRDGARQAYKHAVVTGNMTTMINDIESLPSVKPAERVGRWVGIEYDGYADGNPVYDVWECSECKDEHYGDDGTLTPYCPNCGARMEVQA